MKSNLKEDPGLYTCRLSPKHVVETRNKDLKSIF